MKHSAFFTLKIPEIPAQKAKISSTLKTCGMSDFKLGSNFCGRLQIEIENLQAVSLYPHPKFASIILAG